MHNVGWGCAEILPSILQLYKLGVINVSIDFFPFRFVCIHFLFVFGLLGYPIRLLNSYFCFSFNLPLLLLSKIKVLSVVKKTFMLLQFDLNNLRQSTSQILGYHGAPVQYQR